MFHKKQLRHWKTWSALLVLLALFFAQGISSAKGQSSGSPTIWLPLMFSTQTKANTIHQGIIKEPLSTKYRNATFIVQ